MTILYGPPAEEAWKAAEAIRGLNHASFGSSGYEWPSDVDAVIAGLQTTVERLPQALGQASRWLESAHQLGIVGHDRGIEADDAVRGVLISLAAAVHRAEQLADELATARSDSSHLTGDRGAMADERQVQR